MLRIRNRPTAYCVLFLVGEDARCKVLLFATEAVSWHAPDLWILKIFSNITATEISAGRVSPLPAHRESNSSQPR